VSYITNIPSWGYEPQPPFQFGAFWVKEERPATLPRASNSCLELVQHMMAVAPPLDVRRGMCVAILDRIDQVIVGWEIDNEGLHWFGCQAGFDRVSWTSPEWALDWSLKEEQLW
jgi:hypothetical protein